MAAFTANDPAVRAYAIERAKKCADIARYLGTDLMVVWLAREGTYMREAKDAVRATEQLLEAINAILDHDPDLRIIIEPKPNEPMDMAYIPTMGHALALGMQSSDPLTCRGVGGIGPCCVGRAGPGDEMSFALAFGKLWSVHLNDQNGLKFDQDRSFGSVDLRRAFNQVRVLEENKFWELGMVGLDVKALRTQPPELATKHLSNSLRTFLRLVEIVRSVDNQKVEELRAARDYEELDWLILDALMGG